METGRVGDFDMWFTAGALVRAPRRSALFTKPGHAGRGVHVGPVDAVPQVLHTYAWAADADAAEALWEAYFATQDSSVDVVDGLGQLHQAVTVIGLQPGMSRNGGLQPYGPAGGVDPSLGTWIVCANWLLLLSEQNA